MQPEGLSADKRGVARNSEGTFYFRYLKRVMDLVVALGGLIVTSPLLLLCAVAVRLDSPGPIFFRQKRVGQYGNEFTILKLRTMVHGAEAKGPKLTASDDPRITRIGKWLRRTKIDEIPQLLNVLKGEMSVVGPRPEIPEYVPTYTEAQKRVFLLKPGITGPASLAYIDEEQLLAASGDAEAFYVETVLRRKLDLDLAYCERVSFLGDVRLILLTLRTLTDVRRRRKADR